MSGTRVSRCQRGFHRQHQFWTPLSVLFVPLHYYLICCVVVVVVVMLLSASASRLIHEALCTTNKCKATAAHGTAVVNLRTISGLRRNQLWFDVDRRSAKNLKDYAICKTAGQPQRTTYCRSTWKRNPAPVGLGDKGSCANPRPIIVMSFFSRPPCPPSPRHRLCSPALSAATPLAWRRWLAPARVLSLIHI